MILSDGTIKRMIDEGELSIRPPIEGDQLQSIGIDLRLGDTFRSMNSDNEMVRDVLTFEPDESYQIHTLESIVLPEDVAGEVSLRSSLTRHELDLIGGPAKVHPGFRGQVNLAVRNVGDTPISLPIEERVAQITFYQVDNPVEQPYGAKGESKYQDQLGPTIPDLEDILD